MSKALKFGEVIAKVNGVNCSRESIGFRLRYEEVKHIRRVLSNYDFFNCKHYPEEYEDRDLTRRIHGKFMSFGKMSKRMNSKVKKAKVRNFDQVCSHDGCTERDNLTIDHKRRLCVPVEGGNAKENLQLLCPKHHLLKELKVLRKHKEQELEKVNMRIEEVEEKDTTDCLGYQVLSKDKFEYVDKKKDEESKNNG